MPPPRRSPECDLRTRLRSSSNPSRGVIEATVPDVLESGLEQVIAQVDSGNHWKPLPRGASLVPTMPDEILTVPEVAQLLKVAEKTVYTMAQRGEIPCFKVRGQWRFRRSDLDRWIDEGMAFRSPSEKE